MCTTPSENWLSFNAYQWESSTDKLEKGNGDLSVVIVHFKQWFHYKTLYFVVVIIVLIRRVKSMQIPQNITVKRFMASKWSTVTEPD